MFKIIKKGSGNFWHNFNNGSKEVNLSDWEIVLDSVNQTVSLQMLNGANVPNNSVIISDVVVIDETDSSVEETFVSVSALRTRLIELNYTPYIVLNGFVPEAPIDGLTYGRKDAEWVEVSDGGSTPDATTTVKGKLKLAGDLAGTADLPTVPALADKEETSNKGIANGYVPLNSSTEIDLAYFPDAILGQLLYGGVVNISTAVATLTNNAKTKLGTVLSTITLTNDATAITGYTANEGIYYIATVSGTFAGISFEVGDWLVSIGSAWVKVDNTDAISSFNTRTGAITLISGDVVSALGFTPISNLSPTLSGLVTITGDTQTGSSANGVLIASQVWNTTGSPTAIRLDITNTASGAASKLIDLLVGGVSRFAVDKSGSLYATVITSGGDVNASVTSAFTWGSTNSRATMFSPSNGIIRLSNAAGTDFVRLQLGGTSSSFPSIKRNATAINFRLADDSADCPVTASNGTFSGNVILSGSSSVLRLKGYTVATLPSGAQGDLAFVTDALAPTYNGALTGGGAIVVKVFHNGTSWVSA